MTPTGVAQGEPLGALLARELSGQLPDVVLKASPLDRLYATAALVAAHLPGLVVEEDPLLAEVSVVLWDGMTRYEIEMEFPGAQSRARAWLAGETRPTIEVCRGLFGRVLRGSYLGPPTAEMQRLATPQDAVFRLRDGAETTLAGCWPCIEAPAELQFKTHNATAAPAVYKAQAAAIYG